MSAITKFFKENYDSIIKPTVVMVCICLVVTLALSLANRITKDKIDAITEQTQKEAMSRVLKADEYKKDTVEFKNDDGETEKLDYYTAQSDDEDAGYIFIVNEKGYGGEVSVMTAVSVDGDIIAVEVLDVSNETPGLGQNAAKESFYSQFVGKEAGEKPLTAKKNGTASGDDEIDAVAGATITSRAVTKAVNRALSLFETVTGGVG